MKGLPIKFIVTVLLLFPKAQAWSQKSISSSQDTVFIYFNSTSNSVIELGKSTYFKPELKYPLDIRRNYIINTFEHCPDCAGMGMIYKKKEYLFTAHPKPEAFYYLEHKKEFNKRNYLDKEWFERMDDDYVRKFLKNKVTMLVDPSYLYNDHYYVIRVEPLTHVE